MDKIIPRNGHYVVEVIYRKESVQALVDPSFSVVIDLGVTNLAAITSNREGFIVGKNLFWKQECTMGNQKRLPIMGASQRF